MFKAQRLESARDLTCAAWIHNPDFNGPSSRQELNGESVALRVFRAEKRWRTSHLYVS